MTGATGNEPAGLRTLSMLQLSDTAFPNGSFAHSMGLEAFAEAGELVGEGDLARLVGLHLRSLATSDCVALRAAHGASGLEDLVRADRQLAATKATRELREASSATGRQFLRSVAALGVGDGLLEALRAAVRGAETPGSHAVCYGAAARALGVGEGEAVVSYLFSGAASLVSAGQKLVPLGGGAAQRVLFGLRGEICDAAKASTSLSIGEMYSFAPEIDVRSMKHERQRTRLYIS